MIDDLFQLGDPLEHRGIVIAPLFPRHGPRAVYVTLDEALPLGFRVEEITEAGTVPELLVKNPLNEDVLLYDGEELTGAKQNRILNVSVLVEARSTLTIPVSCVEQGRWQRRSDMFASAAHASNPRLRRRKAEMLQTEPLARGLAQADVWEEVALTAERLRVDSPTSANEDAFRAHRPSLAELEHAFPLQPGQCGAILALGSSLCLDAVSRPDAFTHLWPKLRTGYLLDALDVLDHQTGDQEDLQVFFRELSKATAVRRRSAGRGKDVRLSADHVLGSGLELESELLQVSAFTVNSAAAHRAHRITRPSRRRAA